MKLLRSLMIATILFVSGVYAKTPLQAWVESEFPLRISVFSKMKDGTEEFHTTIVYVPNNYKAIGNREIRIAEYDSTVDEAMLRLVQANCKDSSIQIGNAIQYYDSNIMSTLSYDPVGSYEKNGVNYFWNGRDPLIGVPCKFKRK